MWYGQGALAVRYLHMNENLPDGWCCFSASSMSLVAELVCFVEGGSTGLPST